MKFIHLSDLHIGKKLNDYSLIEDQKYVLNEIIEIIKKENIDGVIIAGDIYDKSIPSSEAVLLFDEFLTKINELNKYVFIVSGNHDSAERLSFGSDIIKNQKIFISGIYNGEVKPVIIPLEDEKIAVYLLPFIKPVNVRKVFPEFEAVSYTEAVKKAVDNMEIDNDNINIIVAHQLVTGAETSESEDISIGGIDNVDVNVFDKFDYAALGHIHKAQNIRRPTVRYCGTPLKYSFSESDDEKSVTIIEINSKYDIKTSTIPLHFLRDLQEIKGKYIELTAFNYYSKLNTDNYFHITLTDEMDIPDAVGKLKTIYHNLMKLDYDNKRTRENQTVIKAEDNFKKPIELISEFYFQQNNQPMSEEQLDFCSKLIEKIWGEY